MFLLLTLLTLPSHWLPWDFVLILLGLGILIPWRGAVRIKDLLSRSALGSRDRLALYVSTMVFQWGMVALVAWRAFSRNVRPAELGIVASHPWKTILLAAAVTLVLCAYQWASLRRLARLPAGERGFMFRFMEKIMPRSGAEILGFTALACTAGVSEEFLYRGFVFAIFVRIAGNSAIPPLATAAVLSSALFGIAHLYQGTRGVLTTFLIGLLLSGMRIWCGNIIAPAVAHAGVDLVAGLYAARLFRSNIISV